MKYVNVRERMIIKYGKTHFNQNEIRIILQKYCRIGKKIDLEK
jgi:hypothetical protein